MPKKPARCVPRPHPHRRRLPLMAPRRFRRFKDLGHRMMLPADVVRSCSSAITSAASPPTKCADQLQAALDKGSSNSDDLILQASCRNTDQPNRRAHRHRFNRVAWIMPFVVLALASPSPSNRRSWKNRPEPPWPMASPSRKAMNTSRRVPQEGAPGDRRMTISYGKCGKCGAGAPAAKSRDLQWLQERELCKGRLQRP